MKTKIKLITKKRLLFALLLFATIIKSQSVGYPLRRICNPAELIII